jgi:hypothetical protein
LLSWHWSCWQVSEEFLDEPKPTDQVSESVVFTSRSGVEAFISGIMRRFRQFDATDSAGLNSIFYARSIGNDAINTTTWFNFDSK